MNTLIFLPIVLWQVLNLILLVLFMAFIAFLIYKFTAFLKGK